MGITNGQLTTTSTPPYSGQIPTSFNYPFSIVLTSPYGSETGTGVFTFYNASNGAYYYYTASTGSGGKINWSLTRGYSYKQ